MEIEGKVRRFNSEKESLRMLLAWDPSFEAKTFFYSSLLACLQTNKSCIKCKKFFFLATKDFYSNFRKEPMKKKSIPQSFCIVAWIEENAKDGERAKEIKIVIVCENI